MPLLGPPNIEKLKQKRDVKGLIKALSHNDRSIWAKAVEAFSDIGDTAVEPLIAAIRDKRLFVRRGAIIALGNIGDARAVEPLTAALKDNYENVRKAAAKALEGLDARTLETHEQEHIPKREPPCKLPASKLKADTKEADALASELSLSDSGFGLDMAQRRVIFATVQRLDPGEISGLQEAIEAGRFRITYHYARMPNYPIFAIKATILDNPANPFWLEVFPDVGVYIREDRGIFKLLGSKETCQFCFHFYDNHKVALFRTGYQMGDYDGLSWNSDLDDAKQYLQLLGGKADFVLGSHQYKAQF